MSKKQFLKYTGVEEPIDKLRKFLSLKPLNYLKSYIKEKELYVPTRKDYFGNPEPLKPRDYINIICKSMNEKEIKDFLNNPNINKPFINNFDSKSSVNNLEKVKQIKGELITEKLDDKRKEQYINKLSEVVKEEEIVNVETNNNIKTNQEFSSPVKIDKATEETNIKKPILKKKRKKERNESFNLIDIGGNLSKMNRENAEMEKKLFRP